MKEEDQELDEDCRASDGTGVSIGSRPQGGKDCRACGGTGKEPKPAAPLEVQLVETRKAFFAGAQHLLGSIMSMLDPGANWFAEHVEGKVVTLALSPRIKFVGEKVGYPKDLALMCAGWGMFGFATWRWGAKPRRTKGTDR